MPRERTKYGTDLTVVKIWGASAVAIAIVGCTSMCPSGVAPSIAGTWTVRPIQGESYSNCRATVEYRSDGTFLTRNGDLEIVGHYALGTEGGLLFYCEWDMRGNGLKSCQGLPSDFVIGHTKPKRRAALEGNVLRLYSTTLQSYFEYERQQEQ